RFFPNSIDAVLHFSGSPESLQTSFVGGSLAVLFTGLALKGIDHNVHILESNPEPLLEDQDAGIIAEASSSLVSTLVERFTLFLVPGTQILAYVIPGKHGTLKQGYRLINWVWYFNFENLSRVLTDCDVLATQAIHFDGRVVLAGDALAGFRPHTVASTSQAAFHASQLCESMRSWDEWVKKQSLYEDTVIEFARLGNKVEQQLGNVSQFGHYEIGGKMRMAPLSIR
ncbi:unnamed protein product, partial [Rotaria magnacalcarata]